MDENIFVCESCQEATAEAEATEECVCVCVCVCACVCVVWCVGGYRLTQTPFRWPKFSHQTKHFCCGSVFLLHDNGVLAPLKLQTFETGL